MRKAGMRTSSFGVGGRFLRRDRGMQLLEFAMVLPFLLVLSAGVMDFAQAWNARQILANAARDGARLGSSLPSSDLTDTDPGSIQQICQQVANYLHSENIKLSFMGISGTTSSAITTGCSSPATVANSACAAGSGCVPSAWTYYTTTNGVTYGLKIERTVQVPLTGTSCGTLVTCLSETRVTLKYPYNWGMGFDYIVNMFGPSSYSSTIRITVISTMQNLAS